MPTYEKFSKNVGVRCIRWGYVFHKIRASYHTLAYVGVRCHTSKTCPKILCMYKISNVCRRIAYTLDIPVGYSYVTCTLRYVHVRYMYGTYARKFGIR